MTNAVSPKNIAAALTEFWSPRIVGEVDDAYVKVAKIQGAFTWHAHDDQVGETNERKYSLETVEQLNTCFGQYDLVAVLWGTVLYGFDSPLSLL